MPHQSPRSIGVNSTALLSQLIVLPMQENEAHGLSVVVPLDLTAPVATLSTRKQSCNPSLQRRNHGSFEPSSREPHPRFTWQNRGNVWVNCQGLKEKRG